jgi:autotransporter-associated beta strand protein
MKKLLILFAFITLQLNAQNSNISIISGSTSGGTWSPLISSLNTGTTYTFTPNVDNATVSKTELDDLLRVKNSNVIINTACVSCTQAGQIDLSAAFSTSNQTGPTSNRTLTLNAGSDVNIANSMTMRSTISSGYNLGSLNLVINAVGNITVTGAITMTNPSTGSGYQNATEGGSVTLNSTAGSVKVTQPINCSGTTNTTNSGLYDGTGGSITIKGPAGVSVSGTLFSTSRLYSAGSITILDGNTSVTTGGANDGISGVINGGAFTKSGTGTLLLSGTNNGVSSSEIIDGTLQLKGGTALPDYNTLTFTGANAVLDLNGYSESIGSIASLNGYGKITSGIAGNITLTLGLSNLNTVYTGLIENGLGVLSLAKYGESLSLGNSTHSTANTYTGLTTIYAGTLAIYHSNSLGATSSGTIVRGTGKLALYNDISVGMEELTLNTNAVSLSNESGVNAWSGSIQITQNASINATAGSLQLNQSIRGTNFSLLMSGAGAVSLRGDLTLGTGALTTSMGTFTLYSWNSYSGGTNVTAGNLVIRSTMGLGTGAATVSQGGALQLYGGITLDNPLAIKGTGVAGTGVIRNLVGNNTLSGTITMTGDARLNADVNTQLSLLGSINAGLMALQIGGAGNVVMNGGLSGTGSSAFTWGVLPLALNWNSSLIKDGAGKLTLNVANTYTGATVLSAGTLELGASEVIQNAAAFLLNGGKLSTQGFSETFGQISLLAEGSSIDLGSTTHTISFSNRQNLDYKTLRINGWQGTAGSAGTAGRIFVATNPVLSKSEVEQVEFSLNSISYLTSQLSTGELVPNPVVVTGNSNVRFTTGSTINGTWSPSLTSNATNTTYLFTPSGNHANINVSDLNLILGTNYSQATINTACVSCTQSGLINVNAPIETWNSHGPNYNKFLVINGNSDVNILAPISLRYAIAGNGDRGNLTLYMNTAGNIYVNADISTNIPGSINATVQLTEGGSINLNSSAGSVYVNAAIDASGAVSTNNASSYSGRGGTIALTGGGGITVNNTLTSLGRTGGNLTFTTNNNVITTDNGVNDGIKQLMKGGNFSKLGTGTLQLSAANQIADLFLYSGTLQAGSATAIPSYSNLYFSGGNFHDGGLTATYYAFHIYENTTITLGNTAHNLTFTTLGGFTNNKMLTISTSDGSSVDAALNTFGALTTTSTSFVNLFGKKQSIMEGGMGRFGAVLNSKLGSTGAPVRFFVKYLLSDSHRAQVQLYNASQNKYYTVSQNPVAVTNGEMLPLRVK